MDSGGGVFAVLEGAYLEIQNQSVISGNTAEGGDGGGVWTKSLGLSEPLTTVTIKNSLISGNTASDRGGGVYTKTYLDTNLLIQDTRVTGNHALNGTNGNGGGVYFYCDGPQETGLRPRFTITGSTVDHNDTFQNGGGMFVCIKGVGDFIATNSTFSTNSTTRTDFDVNFPDTIPTGGGIMIARPDNPGESLDAYLRNVTVTKNVSFHGGGIGIKAFADVRVRIDNSIVSENFDKPEDDPSRMPNNLDGPMVIDETKFNLIGSGSTILDSTTLMGGTLDSTNLNVMNPMLNDDPMLGDLNDNGGPTPTHALLAGSLAIDAGSNLWATMPLTGADPEDPSDDDPLMTDRAGSLSRGSSTLQASFRTIRCRHQWISERMRSACRR